MSNLNYKLNVNYINKESKPVEMTGNFSNKEDLDKCHKDLLDEIKSLTAYNLFKRAKKPQQLELDLI